MLYNNTILISESDIKQNKKQAMNEIWWKTMKQSVKEVLWC